MSFVFHTVLENNVQSLVSQQVANSLGYEWHFIDYKIWILKMNLNTSLDSYLEYGFNGSSVAHLQDFPAVFALKEMGILNKNDVLVPGNALEVIAGSHLKLNMIKCDILKSAVLSLKDHFSGFGYYSGKKDEIYNHLETITSKYNINSNQVAECFDWQERQTKFIGNSVKVYEYFGYDSRIPLNGISS
jgi:asparagine synthase (glutamine-hydrolysing)